MKFTKVTIFSLFSFVIAAAAHNGSHGTETTPTHGQEGKQQNETTPVQHIEHDEDDETPGSGGEYIVLVDDEDPRSIPDLFEELGGSRDTISYIYNNTAFKGFAATMSKHCAGRLSTFGGIKHYEPTIKAYAAEVQNNAPWGLSRISKKGAVGTQEGGVLDLTFTHNHSDEPGAGVDIYVVDTGVNVDHVDFNGRAKWGWAFDGLEVDENGHGTHCAGSAAAFQLGVAKAANIIAVKVLGADGSGASPVILKGFEFVAKSHNERKNQPGFKGSVISMSLGLNEVSKSIDQGLIQLSQMGVHISVAAGNSNVDACGGSPSSASQDSSVISVGAIDINDQRASFSNFGRCVTTYGPGVDVVSTFIDPLNPRKGRNNIINTLSGTSMACPHISGLIASYISRFPELATNPRRMKELIVSSSERAESLEDIEGDPAIIATNLGSLRSADSRKRNVKSVKAFENFGRKRMINNKRSVKVA